MNTATKKPEKLDGRMARSSKKVALWTFAWVVSLALLTFGPRFLWDYATIITLAITAINIGCGYKMILANKSHLADMDELKRTIQLNAMAVSLGASMVFGAVYGVMETIKIIDHSPNPSNILFVMAISYAIALFVGRRRYS